LFCAPFSVIEHLLFSNCKVFYKNTSILKKLDKTALLISPMNPIIADVVMALKNIIL